jgi:hypothetical protein
MKAPRTGGTSILRKVLEPRIPGIIHFKDNPKEFSAWLARVTDAHLNEYFIFSFVRNPWDRFVSIACYLDIPLIRMAKEFNTLRKQEPLRSHSLPLYGYAHCNGARFADFIGRFENLQADFDRVCKRLGLPRTRLPRVSRTDHEHYARYYDANVRRIVARLYADDIKAFGYRFDAE